jgi:hypothetical protein
MTAIGKLRVDTYACLGGNGGVFGMVETPTEGQDGVWRIVH